MLIVNDVGYLFTAWETGKLASDVNKDLTFKAKDKDQTFKAKDQDKD